MKTYLTQIFKTTFIIALLLLSNLTYSQDDLPGDGGSGAGVQDLAAPIDNNIIVGIFAALLIGFYLLRKKEMSKTN